jgi:hypothetical protein
VEARGECAYAEQREALRAVMRRVRRSEWPRRGWRSLAAKTLWYNTLLFLSRTRPECLSLSIPAPQLSARKCITVGRYVILSLFVVKAKCERTPRLPHNRSARK